MPSWLFKTGPRTRECSVFFHRVFSRTDLSERTIILPVYFVSSALSLFPIWMSCSFSWESRLMRRAATCNLLCSRAKSDVGGWAKDTVSRKSLSLACIPWKKQKRNTKWLLRSRGASVELQLRLCFSGILQRHFPCNLPTIYVRHNVTEYYERLSLQVFQITCFFNYI